MIRRIRDNYIFFHSVYIFNEAFELSNVQVTIGISIINFGYDFVIVVIIMCIKSKLFYSEESKIFPWRKCFFKKFKILLVRRN